MYASHSFRKMPVSICKSLDRTSDIEIQAWMTKAINAHVKEHVKLTG